MLSPDTSHLLDRHEPITWEEDYQQRMNPGLMTDLLRAAIPVLAHINWSVTEVREGYCATLLPLNYESTNQHGTHQAALMSLAADYTGGIALGTLLRGAPLAGVHPGTDEDTAALWLAGMDVRYKVPSTGDLTVSCNIEAEDQETIRRRYYGGRRVLARLLVELSSNGEPVSEAEMTYFAQPSKQLRPTRQNPRIHTLYQHKLKASARLIAGLRAGLGGPGRIKTHCPHSRVAAGPHGHLLARRLNGVLPQLQDIVMARTNHLDAALLAGLRAGIQQVVLVGAGLDVRALRYGADALHATFFELDLPEMLSEREQVFRRLRGPSLKRKAVPINLEVQDLHAVLSSIPGFDPTLATAFVYEGCSMYFDEETNRRVLTAMRDLMENPQSFVWVDFVADSIVRRVTKHREVELFLEGMEKLGEAFIFGRDDPDTFLRSLGLQVFNLEPASIYLDTSDPVFSLYRFGVAHRLEKRAAPNTIGSD